MTPWNANGGRPPVIDVRGLSKRFGDTQALNDLSFDVRRGEILGVLGPNGAGKTTTVNLLTTLIAPDEGTATVAGYDIGEDPHLVRRAISMTGQFAAVDDQLTGHENLVLFGRLRGLTRVAAVERATSLLAEFDLTGAATRSVKEYSGGMRRRLDLAASLMIEPQILFLDEPTTGLDPRSRAQLWEVVRGLRERDITIVLTTQYLEEADQLADRIIVIDRGRNVAEGTPSELKRMVGGSSCVISLVDASMVAEAADRLGHLGEVVVEADQARITIAADQAVGVLTASIDVLGVHQIEIHEAGIRQPSLDEVFLALTGADAS